MMTPRLLVLPLSVALACSDAALAHERAPSPVRHEIAMTPESYRPGELTVQLGDTIVWHNTDIVAHSATSRSGAFNSGRMKAGEQYRWVPKEPGRYPYICTKHKLMRGTITVK